MAHDRQRITASFLRSVLADHFQAPPIDERKLVAAAGMLDRLADTHHLTGILLGPAGPLDEAGIQLRHALRLLTERMPEIAELLTFSSSMQLGALCGAPQDDGGISELATAATDLGRSAATFSRLLDECMPGRRAAPWHHWAVLIAALAADMVATGAPPKLMSPAAPAVQAVQRILRAMDGEDRGTRAIAEALTASSRTRCE